MGGAVGKVFFIAAVSILAASPALELRSAPMESGLPYADKIPASREGILEPYTTDARWTIDCRYVDRGSVVVRDEYFYFEDPEQERKFAMHLVFFDGEDPVREIEFVTKDRKAKILSGGANMAPWGPDVLRDRQAKAVRGPTCRPPKKETPAILSLPETPVQSGESLKR